MEWCFISSFALPVRFSVYRYLYRSQPSHNEVQQARVRTRSRWLGRWSPLMRLCYFPRSTSSWVPSLPTIYTNETTIGVYRNWGAAVSSAACIEVSKQVHRNSTSQNSWSEWYVHTQDIPSLITTAVFVPFLKCYNSLTCGEWPHIKRRSHVWRTSDLEPDTHAA
jgi:hypothetical protein